MTYTVPERLPRHHDRRSSDYPIRYYPQKPLSTSDCRCRVGRQYAPQNARPHSELHLTHQEMLDLPEYSASIPSGKGIGKRWRARTNRAGTLWVIGQYAELHPRDLERWPGEIAILTYSPVVDGGKGGVWREVAS